MPEPVPGPASQWDQSLGGKSVEHHQEYQGASGSEPGVTTQASERVKSNIDSLHGDNQVGFVQAFQSRGGQSQYATPPTPAPSGDLDYQNEAYNQRNRGVMTHELSAALAKSKASPGGPTGEQGKDDDRDEFFDAGGGLRNETDQRKDTSLRTADADKSQKTTEQVDYKGKAWPTTGSTAARLPSGKMRNFTEDDQQVLTRAMDLAKQYIDSAKKSVAAGAQKVTDVDLQAAAADAVSKANDLLASLKENVASTARDVGQRFEESGLPQKLQEMEHEYVDLASKGLQGAMDRTVDAGQYIAGKVSTTSFEDVNNSTPARLVFGILLLWAISGLPLKLVATLMCILAGASYAYGQVYRRRHPGHAPVRPQIPRTGETVTIPAGEFGNYKADTGAVQAAKGGAPDITAESSSVETHCPRGKDYAESLDKHLQGINRGESNVGPEGEPYPQPLEKSSGEHDSSERREVRSAATYPKPAPPSYS
eukprot:jgi/Botrbrau1/6250/Bobra.0129s0004.1